MRGKEFFALTRREQRSQREKGLPPGGLLRIWPVASLLSRSSIAADTLPPSRLATGQIGSNALPGYDAFEQSLIFRSNNPTSSNDVGSIQTFESPDSRNLPSPPFLHCGPARIQRQLGRGCFRANWRQRERTVFCRR